MFTKEFKVYLKDTDSTGVVYYSKYLEWFEMVRMDFLEEKYKPLSELDYGFMPVEVNLRMILPLNLGDSFNIAMGLLDVKRCTFNLVYSVETNKAIVANGLIRMACIKDGKVYKIPNELKDIIND